MTSSVAVSGPRSRSGAIRQRGLRRELCSFRDDMETIENMQGLGTFLTDDLQVGFPHVRADEHDLRCDFFTYGGEESLKGVDRSLFADPKQTGDAQIDLINQCQILVAFGILDLIDTDGVDLTELPVLQTPDDNMFDRVALSMTVAAPNGPGRACKLWSVCVCRRPKELLRQSQRRSGDSRRGAWCIEGTREIPTTE